MHHGVNKEIEGIPLAILSRILAQSRVIPLPELCMEELRSIANGDFYDISHPSLLLYIADTKRGYAHA